jgi:hypothetical protein
MPYKTKYIPNNPTKYIGDINSILCRSLWERRFCKYLDSNTNIVRWSFEAVKIPYLSPIDNKMHFYIPDFLIEAKTQNGLVETMLIEIKPKKQTKQPEKNKKQKKTILMENITYVTNLAKWEAANKYCKDNGIVFKILTEEDLF